MSGRRLRLRMGRGPRPPREVDTTYREREPNEAGAGRTEGEPLVGHILHMEDGRTIAREHRRSLRPKEGDSECSPPWRPYERIDMTYEVP